MYAPEQVTAKLYNPIRSAGRLFPEERSETHRSLSVRADDADIDDGSDTREAVHECEVGRTGRVDLGRRGYQHNLRVAEA